MIAKINKKLIFSGILLFIATVCYALYQMLFSSFLKEVFGIENLPVFWVTNTFANIIFISIRAIVLITYCFLPNKIKAGKIIYFFGIAAYILSSVYFILSADGRFGFYVMSDILFLSMTVFMMVVKIKTNKVISTIGTMAFIFYALSKFVAVVLDQLNSIYIGAGISLSAFFVYLMAEFIALFNIWLVEGGNLTFAKRQKVEVKTLLQDDLMFLKQSLDNGTISAEEYNRKKLEILNNL